MPSHCRVKVAHEGRRDLLVGSTERRPFTQMRASIRKGVEIESDVSHWESPT